MQVNWITHIFGVSSDSSTNGWKVGFGGGAAISAFPNLDFWRILDVQKNGKK